MLPTKEFVGTELRTNFNSMRPSQFDLLELFFVACMTAAMCNVCLLRVCLFVFTRSYNEPAILLKWNPFTGRSQQRN